ncbi:hypothetical protein GC194_07785 [bacterium]|nr:hypothetical protein [bacterium]
MNERKRAKDDSVGLDRLFKLTVLGSVLIVLIYAVYYYKNAYRNTRTNIFKVEEEGDVSVNRLCNDTVAAAMNMIFSNNQLAALQNGVGGWHCATVKGNMARWKINERTTVAMSGVVAEKFDELLTNELIRRFNNIPPIEMNPAENGVVVRSIQFEHFAFPYHAMVNWKQEGSYKTFTFYRDSLPGEIETYTDGFVWHSPLHNEYIEVQQCEVGSPLSAKTDFANRQKKSYQVLTMPVVDFDAVYEVAKDLELVFTNAGNQYNVVQSEGEIKLLIGPSLKQNNAYEIAADAEETLEIKPPFFVKLTKEKGGIPYFFAFIYNDKLLLH